MILSGLQSWLFAATLALLFLVSCTKNSPTKISNRGRAAATVQPLSSLISIFDTPGEVSNLSVFEMKIIAAESVQFVRLKFSSVRDDCKESSNWSAMQSVDQALKVDITSLADGDVYFCVLPLFSKSDPGNFDLVAILSWKKDTTPPTAKLDGVIGRVSGETALSLGITSEDGGIKFRYVVGMASEVDCANLAQYGPATDLSHKITDDLSALPNGMLKFCMTIVDASGNMQPLPYLGISWSSDISTPPSIVRVYALSHGPFKAGDSIRIAVDYTSSVIVSGTPRIELNFAEAGHPAYADYSSGSGTKTLVFEYVVSAGVNVSSINYASSAALAGGGVARNGAINIVSSDVLPSTSDHNLLGGDAGLTIDNTAPTPPTVSSPQSLAQVSASGFIVSGGGAEPNSTVLIYMFPSEVDRAHGTRVGSAIVASNGAWSVFVSIDWGSVVHLRTIAVDALGNTSAPSSGVTTLSFSVPALTGGVMAFVGGDFSGVGSQSTFDLAGIASDGSIHEWNPYPNSTVFSAAATCSSVYIGGAFESVAEASRKHLASIASDGVLDDGWQPDANGTVYAMAVTDNTVYVGGGFTAIGGQVRNRLGAIAFNGALLSWNPSVNGAVRALAVADSIIFVGGNFTDVDGQARGNLAAIVSNGTLDSWDPEPNGPVYAIAVSGQTVYVAGDFTEIAGQVRQRLASFNLDGTIQDWNPNANSAVRAITISGSTVFVGGDFTTIAGAARNRLAAIGIGGVLQSWNPNSNGIVRSLAIKDSTVYLGGDFSSIGSAARHRLAAVGFDGVIKSWNPPVSDVHLGSQTSRVQTIAFLPDNCDVIGSGGTTGTTTATGTTTTTGTTGSQTCTMGRDPVGFFACCKFGSQCVDRGIQWSCPDVGYIVGSLGSVAKCFPDTSAFTACGASSVTTTTGGSTAGVSSSTGGTTTTASATAGPTTTSGMACVTDGPASEFAASCAIDAMGILSCPTWGRQFSCNNALAIVGSWNGVPTCFETQDMADVCGAGVVPNADSTTGGTSGTTTTGTTSATGGVTSGGTSATGDSTTGGTSGTTTTGTTSATGGVTSGGTSATGDSTTGGTSATGGVTSGSTSATGDATTGGTSATGDATSATGDATSATGDATSATGDATSATGDATSATGDATSATGDATTGGTSATGDATTGGTSATGDATSATAGASLTCRSWTLSLVGGATLNFALDLGQTDFDALNTTTSWTFDGQGLHYTTPTGPIYIDIATQLHSAGASSNALGSSSGMGGPLTVVSNYATCPPAPTTFTGGPSSSPSGSSSSGGSSSSSSSDSSSSEDSSSSSSSSLFGSSSS